MNLANWTWLAVPLGLVGVLASLTVFSTVRPLSAGNEIMRAWAANATGRVAELVSGWRYLLVGAPLGLAGLAWLLVGARTAAASMLGAGAALALGWASVRLAAAADVRVAEAARGGGLRAASRAALNASTALGLAIGALGVLGIGLVFYLDLVRGRGYPVPAEILGFAEAAAGLVLGAVGVALLVHLAATAPAGDRQAASDVAATAGVSTDLFGSYLAAVVATVTIGAGSPAYARFRLEAITLPIWIMAAGLIAALAGAMMLPLWERAGAPVALRNLRVVAVAVFVLLAWAVVAGFGWAAADSLPVLLPGLSGPFWAVLGGALAGAAAGWVHRTEIAAAWLFLLLVAAGAAYMVAGLYGVGLAAVGMLGTVGITGASEALRRIARGARDIARVAGLDPEVREVAGSIAARGDSAAFQVGAAALAALSLVAAMVAGLGLTGLEWLSAGFAFGALLGLAAPAGVRWLFAWDRAGRTLPTGNNAAAARFAVFWANVRLRNLAVLGGGAVVLPILVGLAFGVNALGGLVVGATLAATVLALFAPDASVPVFNSLLKLMAATALVLAPMLGRRWGLEALPDSAMRVFTLWVG